MHGSYFLLQHLPSLALISVTSDSISHCSSPTAIMGSLNSYNSEGDFESSTRVSVASQSTVREEQQAAPPSTQAGDPFQRQLRLRFQLTLRITTETFETPREASTPQAPFLPTYSRATTLPPSPESIPDSPVTEEEGVLAQTTQTPRETSPHPTLPPSPESIPDSPVSEDDGRLAQTAQTPSPWPGGPMFNNTSSFPEATSRLYGQQGE